MTHKERLEKLDELLHKASYKSGYVKLFEDDFDFLVSTLRAEIVAHEETKANLSTKIQRTVNAARGALLEMSAWLGIPDQKRIAYIGGAMENVNFCAEHDLHHIDESQRNREIQSQLALEKECVQIAMDAIEYEIDCRKNTKAQDLNNLDKALAKIKSLSEGK